MVMMNKAVRGACKRQIVQSCYWGIILSIIYLLNVIVNNLKMRSIWFEIIYHLPLLWGLTSKGVLACLDLIHYSTCFKTVIVKHVCLDVYVSFSEKYLYGEICYLDPNVTNQSKLKNLPMLRLIHDIELMGEPQESYFKNHQYKITYLRFSRIIIKIEDLTPGIPSEPVPIRMYEGAINYYTRKRRAQDKAERKRKEQERNERKKRKKG